MEFILSDYVRSAFVSRNIGCIRPYLIRRYNLKLLPQDIISYSRSMLRISGRFEFSLSGDLKFICNKLIIVQNKAGQFFKHTQPYLFKPGLPHGGGIGNVDSALRAFHPANTAMPALFVVRGFGHIHFWIYGKDIHRA